MSAYAQVWGQYDYNAHHLAPPGCKCIIHEAPSERGTFAKHGTIGFYVGTVMNHYRCYNVFIPEIGGIQKGLTVDFSPKHVQMPTNTPEDRLAAALENIKTMTQGKYDDTNNAIEELRAILTPQEDSIQRPRVKIKYKKQKHDYAPPVNGPNQTVEHQIGTRIKKTIHGIPYRGQVMQYDPKRTLYWIEYEDVDYEELSHNEVENRKCGDHPHEKIQRFTRSSMKTTLQAASGKHEKKNQLINWYP